MLAAAVVTVTASSVLAAPAHAAGPPGGPADFTEQALYARGLAGYACYRIPAIVRTTAATLLAFAEARRNDCGDDGDVDLVVRRSTDGGRTWGPVQLVGDNGPHTFGNPVPVVDAATGRVVLVTTHNPGDVDRDRTVHVQHSDDDGRTWSAPRDITAQVKDPAWDRWYATGPMHGIQLTRGEHAGRLVVGASHESADERQVGGHLVYSDDGGLNWRVGANAEHRPDTIKPQEMSVVELVDGRVYAAARDQGGTDPGHRAFAVSADGGETFEKPFRTIPELQTPIIQGSALRWRAVDEGDAGNRILFSAPAHPAGREAMSIRSSYDEGGSWESWQDGKIVHWGPSGYSDLTAIDEDTIGLLYERGKGNPYEEIVLARFGEAYLEQPNGTPPNFPEPPAPGPTTPDVSKNAHTAYVRGTPGLTEGRFGSALAATGGQHVHVPLTDELDLRSDDFTVTAWFSYDQTAGAHTLLWAYRMGSENTPQLWLRAEPGSNRIRAHLAAEEGHATIASTSAFNDGRWHHVVLQRGGGRFRMIVDGAEVAVAAAPLGSVSAGGAEFGIDGVHIGQRVDGADRWHGALDEVRVYRRALPRGQLDAIRAVNRPIGAGLELRLPLDGVGR
ncbi:neuraminidase [Saccharopolyspora erythraea NRRL 2338]|uniref:exo-alpha-sialidase n=1 Tax=Saccharopolyspora erythraea (strain ATCC 11635 / DSM 40517 / JCM 4748 / NBRC 13426 / NCIMB 8594 / NRRL 2338) TaxID=405948 RepID=A4FK28_SACEN|nr:neuraminidase [Saccharopolyspora erythraea D]QRK88158.1 exo-alpha-sialidase [Saccharopolyspora erythraea]CAM04403.1 neuraminidase [Saccharopolyspora erythraea NRRL 2338]